MRVCPTCAARFAGPGWTCPDCGWRASSEGHVYRCLGGPVADVAYDAKYFEYLSAIEGTHFWFVARNALLVWALGHYFPDAASMLEVGCGTGQVAAALQRANPKLRLTGTEVFMEGLEIAAQRVPGAEFVQADLRQLPFEAEFDVVGAFDVLEHLREDAPGLREIVRAVRPGGGVIVTVPQHRFLWSAMDEHAGHSRRYSSRTLGRLMTDCGLRIERMTSFVSLLLPLMSLSRVAQRSRPSLVEFRIGPLANRAGRLVMTLERGLIQAGASLPLGGSLLAVARRDR